MTGRLIRIAEGFLYAGNVMLLFFLCFEDHLALPAAFQTMGRMHPLLLHFPIVLILMALGMEFFRFRKDYREQSFYQLANRYLLLFAAFSGVLTALMGLFLAQEDGYAGEILNWHKWTGAGIVFISSFLYAFRDRIWYTKLTARFCSVISVIVLILAGHFGATLTHGEDFVLAPMKPEPKRIPLDEAQLFAHLILPVLDQKCNSCHKPSKAKGELDMTTAVGLLKGGKNGRVFTAGKAGESLMFERIHLSEEDKKHMPPKGKPQLTEVEKELLKVWINSNLSMETRVASLPLQDSIRILAGNFLDTSSEEVYDFKEANPETVRKLSNNYRSVVPLAENSPALDVSFFSPSTFQANHLDELLQIAEQVVGMNLNKMPVINQEMKTLAKFKNLRRLNLNFSEIDGTGLQELVPLKRLKYLSLAGTAVDAASVEELAEKLKGLNTVVLWATGLTRTEVGNLTREYPEITWVYEREETEEDILQLNLPRLDNASNIFKDSLVLALGHPIRDVEIRFTVDGSMPDREHSAKFVSGQTVLKDGMEIKAKAYKEGWLESEVTTFDVYRSRNEPDSVIVLQPFNQVHPAAGAATFFDKELGTFNANSPAWANNWAGFRNNPMELLLEYRQKALISSVSLRILVESSNVIFPPSSIEVWGGDDPASLKLLGKMNPDQPAEAKNPYIELVTCEFKPTECRYVKVLARPVEKIASWSGSRGGRGLLLVDELFVN
jgi:uncharacterized membrane protein